MAAPSQKKVQLQMGGLVKAVELREMLDDLIATGRMKGDGNGFVPT
jgi:hypothetical protein